MRRIWLVARREWLEHRRQPMMLLAMGAVQAMICLTVFLGIAIMALNDANPQQKELLKANLAFVGYPVKDPVRWAIDLILTAFNFLIFTQQLGMTAVLSGHSLLHERQCGTLPFLMVAPIRKGELLLGKVLASAGTPFLLTLLIAGPTALACSAFSVTDFLAWRLPPASGWSVAFLLGGPLWSMALAGLGAAVSTRSKDVRTAQQGVWLVVFFASLLVSGALGGGLQEDVVFQLAWALMGLGASGITIAGGTLLLRRDITL